MASVKEMTADAKNANGATMAAQGDVEVQLEKLRADMAALAAAVTAKGAEQAAGYRSRVREAASDALGVSQEAVHKLGEELKVLEHKVEQQVRERPVRSLGIAAAVGFALALVAVRR